MYVVLLFVVLIIADSAADCVPGEWTDWYHAGACKSCDVGYICPDPNWYTPCPAGHYCSLPGMVTATPCAAGTFSSATMATSQEACQLCNLGSYCPQASTTQTPCSAGHYCSNSYTQTVCSTGYYCPIGSTIQTPCLAGSYCPSGTTAQTQCPTGTYVSTSAPACLTCTQCSAGKNLPICLNPQPIHL